jgi:TetR/AcrR family transcriptional repressor of mexJK operon
MPPRSPAGPGRPKDLAKREAILAAAQTLFLAHGYEGSSMDAIASAAGVSKLTLYSHFQDKETLFGAAVKATCETRLPRRLFELGDDCAIEEVLRAIGEALVALANSPESIGLHRAMATMATQNPALPRMFYEAGPRRLLGDLEQLFSDADRRGLLAVAAPALAAEHFCSLLKGTRHQRLLIGYVEDDDDASASAHVDDVVGLLLRAYRR